MTDAEIEKTVRDILVNDFEIDEAKLTPEADLVSDLDLDSIDAVDLIVRLRREVNFEIKSEDFKAIRTVGDLLDVLERVSTAEPSK